MSGTGPLGGGTINSQIHLQITYLHTVHIFGVYGPLCTYLALMQTQTHAHTCMPRTEMDGGSGHFAPKK